MLRLPMLFHLSLFRFSMFNVVSVFRRYRHLHSSAKTCLGSIPAMIHLASPDTVQYVLATIKGAQQETGAIFRRNFWVRWLSAQMEMSYARNGMTREDSGDLCFGPSTLGMSRDSIVQTTDTLVFTYLICWLKFSRASISTQICEIHGWDVG